MTALQYLISLFIPSVSLFPRQFSFSSYFEPVFVCILSVKYTRGLRTEWKPANDSFRECFLSASPLTESPPGHPNITLLPVDGSQTGVSCPFLLLSQLVTKNQDPNRGHHYELHTLFLNLSLTITSYSKSAQNIP